MVKSDNEANKIRIMTGTLMECDELVERIQSQMQISKTKCANEGIK